MANKPFSLRSVAAFLTLSLAATSAYALDVTVAYQTSAEPAKVAQADNAFAKASGAKVDWRKFRQRFKRSESFSFRRRADW